MSKVMEKFWDIVGEILAVALVVVYALLILNANFNFISNVTVLKIFDFLRTYGSLVLIGVVGLEAMAKRNFIFKLIFLILCAIIVVFLFFPDTYSNLIGVIAHK
jgi:hypothetical protein